MNSLKRIAATVVAVTLTFTGTSFGSVNKNPIINLGGKDFMVAEAAYANRSCGTDLNWSISGDTLTIYGSGTEIKSYARYSSSSQIAPWRSYASSIKKVILPKNLKKIGDNAFYNMTSLEYINVDGGNTLPDLEEVGAYAFSGCNSLRGNNASGSLTFGTGKLLYSESAKLVIKDSAFEHCNNVRTIYVMYPQMEVEKWGFYQLKMLQAVYCPNTKVKLGYGAFYSCSALTTVNIKPSELPIHNRAFVFTPYYDNGMTNAGFKSQDIGSCKKLNGKQLVVNLFVDAIKLNQSNIFEREYNSGTPVTLGNDEIAIKQSSGSIRVYKKDKISYQYHRNKRGIYYNLAWDASKTSRTENSVISLNNIDYYGLSNNENISTDFVQNGRTNSFFGSYVTSSSITSRLNDVRTTMEYLKSTANEYGSSFQYMMTPETNFYITYDSFDWNKEGNVTKGYSNSNTELCIGENTGESNVMTNIGKFRKNKNNPLFQCLKNASKQLTGEKAQIIDLESNSRDSVSNYTNYLKKKYNVDGVIYLIHINSKGQSTSSCTNIKQFVDMDEFAVIYSQTGDSNKGQSLIQHEICHLFGACDFYENSGDINRIIRDFAAKYYPDDIMQSTGKVKISPATAYSIGWLDKIDSWVYNNTYKYY
ncbi:leucine-rich repeat domain-containing protein [uncultured Ruminococcus sp.]|uniref:leucine-rich repeat domain-containing protein n=1 Tax=uncultured Ruminococcus sp. TaxID=165186 RepID=UPI00260E2EAD|nr:leucine-rich repeat domain-containing protein [uncultured Ruminococcus sp.]